MILDEPIEYRGELCRNFIFGCRKLGKFISVFGEDGLREDEDFDYNNININKENNYGQTEEEYCQQ